MLEVLLHRLLPDHLFDLPLRIHVERILVQQSHLLQAFPLTVLILADHLQPDVFEPSWVVDRLRQRRPLLPHLRHSTRIPQYTQPCRLNLRGIARMSPLLRLLLLVRSTLATHIAL